MMEDLSVFKAVVQILNAIKFSSPVSFEQEYSLHIKTVRPFENTDEDKNLLFHLKLTSSGDISSKDILESDELIKIVHKMQAIEEESHLCVQEVNPDNPQMILQKGYTVENIDKETLKLTESWMKEKKRKNNQGVTIHLRVYQLKHLMIKEYSKICQYLKLMKIFNEQMVFNSSMVVEDNVCINEYNCSYVPVIDSKILICSNAEYYMNSQVKPVCPRIYPFCGDSVILPSTDIGCGLHALFRIRIVSFQIAYRSNCIDPHSHAFVILYGPDGVPILPYSSTCDPYNVLTELPWNNYQFKYNSQVNREDCCSCGKLCKGTFNPQLDVQLLPVYGQYYQQIVYIMTLVDLLDECNTTVMKTQSLEWLSNNWCKFIQNNTELIQKAMISSLDKTMCMKSKKSSENLYNKAISDITASISSIIMRSTNDDFRGKCFKLLQVNSTRSAEQQLEHKLRVIASSRGLLSYNDEQCRRPDENKENAVETPNDTHLYDLHTGSQLIDSEVQRSLLNEEVPNDALETDLSESEINKSFEISEQCMWQVSNSQSYDDSFKNTSSLHNDISQRSNHQYSEDLLDIEDDTMMSITMPFEENEMKVTEYSQILERNGAEEEGFVYDVNSAVADTSSDEDILEHTVVGQHDDKYTDLDVVGNTETVMTEDSEEWFNDVLHDVDDWLLSL